MPLRLVEVTVPDDRRQALADLVEGEEVLQAWVSGSEGLGTARMLVDAVRAEAVTDGLVERLGSSEGFRIVLLPVEAALPDLSTDDAEGESGDQRPGSRISREELYQDVAHSSRLTSVYLLMVGLSTIVAAVGLTRGDVAIIIGAMVMAPLLGPNIALSLAAT
ncbi:MAG: TIGR00341 family protein, partial [Gemmatimonadota bacterium]|nr:TIGR00341 family protein [Gemmatimonadota bacterium]